MCACPSKKPRAQSSAGLHGKSLPVERVAPTHGSRGHLAGDASASLLSTKCLPWQGRKWGCRAPIPQCEIHLGCVWVKSAQKARGWHGEWPVPAASAVGSGGLEVRPRLRKQELLPSVCLHALTHLATDWMTLDEVSLRLVKRRPVPPRRMSRSPP